MYIVSIYVRQENTSIQRCLLDKMYRRNMSTSHSAIIGNIFIYAYPEQHMLTYYVVLVRSCLSLCIERIRRERYIYNERGADIELSDVCLHVCIDLNDLQTSCTYSITQIHSNCFDDVVWIVFSFIYSVSFHFVILYIIEVLNNISWIYQDFLGGRSIYMYKKRGERRGVNEFKNGRE